MPSLVSVGLLRDTLLPNLAFHASLAAPTYLLARLTDYYPAKDVLWALAPALNAWWNAIGHDVLINGKNYESVANSITRPGWLVLTGVSLWGARLAYRIVSRSIRKGTDARYEHLQTDPEGWNKSLLIHYIPETLTQTLLSLAVVLPFQRVPVIGINNEWAGVADATAIGLWSAGFALELLADWQLASHKGRGLVRDGVFSIVRHPNYLGDFLTSLAYPAFLFANHLFNPLSLLSPLTNLIFLRRIAGDAETEASQEARYRADDLDKYEELQEWRKEKNAFWPGINELWNGWYWTIVGTGVVGALAERVVRRVWLQ